MAEPWRVVILGGGFGGAYTARHLERLTRHDSSVQITLISRDNYFLMTPLLFEAGSGVLEPRHAVTPLRRMLDRTEFIAAEVERVDLEARMVHCRHSVRSHPIAVPYDDLVVAVGGVVNRAIIPGSEHALAFKTLADAIFLRNHLIDLFEQADVETDPARKEALLTLVIVGGGLVGVELVGEITEFLAALDVPYRNIAYSDLKVHLLDAGPRILKEMDEDLAAYAAAVLQRRGVTIHTQAPVQAIEPGRVHLANGVLSSQTILLSAGVAPNPLLATLTLEKVKGRIATTPAMQSKSRPEVWALGDCAAIPDPHGQPYPTLAQHATREARVLASNLVARRRGLPLVPFVYSTRGTLASLGHYAGVGRVGKIKIRGFLAWWVWRTYYLLQMPRFERKLRVVLDWTVDLFFRNDIVKLALFGTEPPHRQTPANGAEVRGEGTARV